jgi:histidinol dehydrogenase
MTDLYFPIYTPDEGRETILKRQLFDDYVVPESVLQRLESTFGDPVTPEEAVRRILRSVRDNGDAAIRDWNKRIDNADLEDFTVPKSEFQAALDRIPDDLRMALQTAADRIRAFHEQQPLNEWMNGEGLGQVIRPIERVGVYVPGGTAPLPSSLLMTAVPAQVAGVNDIIMTAPPGPNGVPDVTLAAAAIIGLDRMYMVGGAQAVAAMAFGTETVPRVDKIFGPGNLFVTLAKRQVYGMCGIDGLPGPTETMVIADSTADPGLAAADLLAQAEHDVVASAILLTPDRDLAERVVAEVAKRVETLSRRDIIEQSFKQRSGAVIVDDLAQAFELANAYAAEHLCLLVENPLSHLDDVRNAGGIFFGEHSFEVLGDYVAGPSHVMPTGGTARFASPLNLWDFVKITSVVNMTPEDAALFSKSAALLAHAEGLDAHAAAATARIPTETDA